MSEFGHFSGGGPGFRIDIWGAGPFVIVVDGKTWRFETSERFGPVILGKQDQPLENQPGSRSPFWRGFTCWQAQGRRLDPDGITCIWDEPKPTKIRKSGRIAFIVEHGDPYWDAVEVVGPITMETMERFLGKGDDNDKKPKG